MDWKLFNRDNELIQEVNCQYDACDIAEMYKATKLEIDFKKKEAKILETNTSNK